MCTNHSTIPNILLLRKPIKIKHLLQIFVADCVATAAAKRGLR